MSKTAASRFNYEGRRIAMPTIKEQDKVMPGDVIFALDIDTGKKV